MTQVRRPGSPTANGTVSILVFLHGAGENESDYTEICELASDHDFIGVAVSGPHKLANGGCVWTQESLTTRNLIINALTTNELISDLLKPRIFLCGFSQGATHAFDLLATDPETFRGGIVLSPGEGPIPSVIAKSELKSRPMFIAYGQAEFRIFRKRAEKFARMWQRERLPWILTHHSGGHHFPSDWRIQMPRWLEWLSQETEGCRPVL
jgi:predicted esterase